MQQVLCAGGGPAHLLFLAHAPVDQLIDRRLDMCGGHALAVGVGMVVVQQRGGIALEIFAKLIEQFIHVVDPADIPPRQS